MNIDEGFLPLVSIEEFGNVFHGSYDTVLGFLNRDGLPIDDLYEAEAISQANTNGSCTHLVDFGLPAVTTPPDEEAKGWLRWNKAYLFGVAKNYSINSVWQKFGEGGWPYRSPDGTVWHLIAYAMTGVDAGKIGIYGKRFVGITTMFMPEQIPDNLLFSINMPAGSIGVTTYGPYALFSPDGKKAAIHYYRSLNVIQYVIEVDVSLGSEIDSPVITGAVTLDYDDFQGPKAVTKSSTNTGRLRKAFSGYTRISGPLSSVGWFAETADINQPNKNNWYKFGMVFEDVPSGPQGGPYDPGNRLTYVLFVGYDRYGVRQLVELEQISNAESSELYNFSIVDDCHIPFVPPTYDPGGVPHSQNRPPAGGTMTFDSRITYWESQAFLRNGKVVAEISVKETREYTGGAAQVFRPSGWQPGVSVPPTSGLTKDELYPSGTLVSTTYSGNGRDAGGVWVGDSYTTFEYQTCGLNVWCMKRPNSNEVFGWVTPDWQAAYGGIGIGTISVSDVPKIAADPLTGAFSSTTIRYF